MRISGRPRRCASRKRPMTIATSASPTSSTSCPTRPGRTGFAPDCDQCRPNAVTRSGTSVEPEPGAARRARGRDRPRTGRLRRGGARRGRRGGPRLRARRQRDRGDLEHVENLSVDSYVATVRMEQSGDLSSTQAQGGPHRDPHERGGAGVDRANSGIRTTRCGGPGRRDRAIDR